MQEHYSSDLMAPRCNGQTTFFDKLKIFLTLCGLPVAPVVRLLLSPFRPYDRHKSWRRLIVDSIFRYSSSSLRVNQMQYFMGTTADVYKSWIKKNKRPTLVDDLGNGGSLLWFTDRRTSGKIVFYLHGGVYQLPMQEHAAPFWLSNLENNKKETGEDFALVALQYSLYPAASFPTQLLQATNGLSRLLSLGCNPEDIHLVGESAGGGLILQVMSHLLHPYQNIPPVSLPAPLGSTFMMSPWVCLTTEAPSFASNSDSDILPKESWAYLASDILAKLPESGKPYVEARKAPKDWWKGLDKLVQKITIYTGEAECLRDDNVSLGSALKRYHENVTLFIHRSGVHTDPYLTHLARERESKEIVDLILGHFRR